MAGTVRSTTSITLAGLKREIKKNISDNDLKKLKQLLKKYAENKKINRDKLPDLMKEIEQEL